jgi:hypothetical protein
VALGDFSLLTDEDKGEPYFDDGAGAAKPPDFQVIDSDGQPLLIEVKNVSPGRPLAPHRMRATEVEALQRYGELMRAPVAVAHYWSAWNRWTLVRLQRLARRGTKYEIRAATAMKHDMLPRFGDAMVGVEPPLRLTYTVSRAEQPPVPGGTPTLRIDDIQVAAGGVDLTDSQEREIALFFLLFGDWPVETSHIHDDDGGLLGIEIISTPSEEVLEQVGRQGFAVVGSLSSMYAARYNALTLGPDGDVRELRDEPDPGQLSGLVPGDYWDLPDRDLNVWMLRVDSEP